MFSWKFFKMTETNALVVEILSRAAKIERAIDMACSPSIWVVLRDALETPHIGSRIRDLLEDNNINTLEELIEFDRDNIIMRVPNIGGRTYDLICEGVKKAGRKLKWSR